MNTIILKKVSDNKGKMYFNILMIFISVVTFIAILYTSLTLIVVENVLTDKLKQTQRHQLNTIITSVDGKLGAAETLGIELANSKYLKKSFEKLSNEEKMYFSNDFLNGYHTEPSIYSIYIAFRSGRVISSLANATDIRMMRDNSWVEEFNKNYPIYINSKYQMRSFDDYTLLTRMFGFTDSKNEENGAVILNIDTDKLLKEFAQNNLVVSNKDGQLLFGDAQMYENAIKGEKRIRLQKNNQNAFVSCESENNGFVYYQRLNVESMNSQFGNIRLIIFLFAIAFWIISLTIIIRGLNVQMKPFVSLINKVKNLDDSKVRHDNEAQMIEEVLDNALKSNKKMENYYEMTKNTILQSALIELSYNGAGEDKFLDLLGKYGQELPYDTYASAVIEINADDNVKLRSQSLNSIFSRVQEFDGVFVLKLHVYENRCTILLNYDAQKIVIARELQKIRGYISKEYNCNACIGVGSSFKALSKYRASFREALLALSHGSFKNGGSVVGINDIFRLDDGKSYFYSFDDEQSLIEAIKGGNEKSAINIIQKIIYNIRQSITDINYIRNLMYQILNTILRALNIVGSEYSEVYGNEFSKDIFEFNACENSEEMEDFLIERIKTVAIFVDKRRKAMPSKVVELVKKYIENHIGEDISLDILSDNVGLSKNYLSNLFKTTENMGLKDYIIQEKMKMAGELLCKTRHNVSVIGEMVGIDNSRSFFRIFKSYYHMTPSDFRKTNSQNQGAEKEPEE